MTNIFDIIDTESLNNTRDFIEKHPDSLRHLKNGFTPIIYAIHKKCYSIGLLLLKNSNIEVIKQPTLKRIIYSII